MSEYRGRPNPDELLARVQAQERQKTRGKLKIFLGYAAGVGKTYAMLEAAHQRKEQGIDVVVGYIETHGRAETEARLEGLEVLARKQIEYRGVTLPEMDVDAVLARKPQLVLVDELAHTNVPSTRHPKRYQDVEELLAEGIDVYSTLNVQHLESLNDIVAQITGILVRETVPDSILDEASELELVDLPPDELLQRLREGKVYIPEQAARSIQQFFRKGNLTALRELTMRRAADRVDEQMRDYMQTRAIRGPWQAGERLLVCVSPGPLGERLVRNGRRLADELNAEWFVLYVEALDHSHLSDAQLDQLARLLQLAEELGAQVSSLPGASVVSAVLEFAQTHNITKIIAGKPLRSRWREILRSSVVDHLIRESGNIDVYVISGAPGEPAGPNPSYAERGWVPHRPLRRYVQALALVGVATILNGFIAPNISPTNLIMVYLLAVVIAAVYLGRGPAVIASFFGVLAFDFFFVPPFLTFAVSDTEYLFTFFGLFVVGVVISQLTSRVREQADAARQRETETATLYSLSRDLAVASHQEDILQAIFNNVSQTFGREVAVLLPGAEIKTVLVPYESSEGFNLDENETAVATWAFQHGQSAGRGTDTLPAARARYLPLRTARGVLGVMGIGAGEANRYLSPEGNRLLDAFASLAALAIERAQLAEAAHDAQLLKATEKLQNALLNSISHDLRTPLVSITGALTSLQADGTNLDAATRVSLIENAHGEAARLNRLVDNLLDMTRLESGALTVNREPVDIEDLIGAALEALADRLDEYQVHVEVPRDLPLVPLDFGLMAQVLINLIDNAVKYSPPGSPIEIRAQADHTNLEIKVADRGVGIPTDDLARVFDKFYRVQRPQSVSGTGMGLAICKGFVEAHGGKIWAENRAEGGTLIRLTLPRLTLPLSVRVTRPIHSHG